jgi:hypothetical protein
MGACHCFNYTKVNTPDPVESNFRRVLREPPFIFTSFCFRE